MLLLKNMAKLRADILRFLTQKGIAVIPRSTQPEHIKENFDLFNFSLTADEIAQPSCYSV